MGLDSKNLPDNIIRRMDGKEKPKGNAGLTNAEADVKRSLRLEKEYHKQFCQWLDLHGFWYVHSTYGRKATIRAGLTDFIVLFDGKVLCIEMKLQGQALGNEQGVFENYCYEQGLAHKVSYSAQQAIEMTRTFYNL